MRLLFVCIENSNRSQMAEAFARMHGDADLEVHSAGSRPRGKVNPDTIAVMEEQGYDLSAHRSKGLEAVPEGPYDAVVTMGCGDECPWIPATHRMDWSIPDPAEDPEIDLRRVRDIIEREVMDLIKGLKEA